MVGFTILTESNSNSPFNNGKNFGDRSNSSLLNRFSPSLDTKLISLTDNLSPENKERLISPAIFKALFVLLKNKLSILPL